MPRITPVEAKGKKDGRKGPRSASPSTLSVPPVRGVTSYHKDFTPRAAREVASLGGGVFELAAAFGVGDQTIYNWMREHPEFLLAIREGQDEWGVNIAERALYRLAKGEDYTEVKSETTYLKMPGPDGKKIEVPGIRETRTTKRVMPNPTAVIFVLCNRQPERWRSVMQHVVGGNFRHQHDLPPEWVSKLETKELDTLAEILSKVAVTPSDFMVPPGAGLPVDEAEDTSETGDGNSARNRRTNSPRLAISGSN